MKGKCTTVNTDAGIRGDVAAYAYWIRKDGELLRGSGILENSPKNSNEAELCAILNALSIVSESPSLRSSDYIVVNCDNTQALEVLRSNQINGYEKYANTYKEIREKISCPIIYKHVKGHSNGTKPREWVNNWCDMELRKHYT